MVCELYKWLCDDVENWNHSKPFGLIMIALPESL